MSDKQVNERRALIKKQKDGFLGLEKKPEKKSLIREIPKKKKPEKKSLIKDKDAIIINAVEERNKTKEAAKLSAKNTAKNKKADKVDPLEAALNRKAKALKWLQ